MLLKEKLTIIETKLYEYVLTKQPVLEPLKDDESTEYELETAKFIT